MAGIFLGTPSRISLPTDLQQWTSCQHSWTCDGQTWDLSSEQSGTFLMPGVRGINEMPPVVHYRQKAAAVPGSRWRGSSTDQREVYWPICVASGDGSQEWLDFDARFWATMRPNKTGVWAVTQPGRGVEAGQTRYLTLRYESQADPENDLAPELQGWADYGIYLTAEQPYWAGETITKTWGKAVQANFYGGGSTTGHGYGPPFQIASASSLERAAIDNPGELDARLRWTVFGPSQSASVGVGGKNIGIPFPLQAGEWVRINTARTDQRAMFGSGAAQVDGRWVIPADSEAAAVNRTRDLASTTRFGEVPAGGTVGLAIDLVGQGSVQADLTPLYWRDH